MLRNMYFQEVQSPLFNAENLVVQNTGNFGSLQVVTQTLFPTSSPNVLAFRRTQNRRLSQIAQQYKKKLEERNDEEESPTTKQLKMLQNKYSNSISWLDRIQEQEEQEEYIQRQQKIKENQSKEQEVQKPIAVSSLLAKRAGMQGKFNLKLKVVDPAKSN